MKQKDIILIIVVVFISAVLSIVLSNLLISSPKNRKSTVEVVEPIKEDFLEADSKYFNSNSIDPTKQIKIGDQSNPTPFRN